MFESLEGIVSHIIVERGGVPAAVDVELDLVKGVGSDFQDLMDDPGHKIDEKFLGKSSLQRDALEAGTLAESFLYFVQFGPSDSCNLKSTEAGKAPKGGKSRHIFVPFTLQERWSPDLDHAGRPELLEVRSFNHQPEHIRVFVIQGSIASLVVEWVLFGHEILEFGQNLRFGGV